MSDTHSSSARVNALRLKTIDILGELLETAEQFGLPQPLRELEPLEMFRQKLVENTYEVLVVGEVKRGKSTFVNALMGRDLLPTDPDVATSQVFYIRRSLQEAYRLRFEDGSEKLITSDDLVRYGSQVWADREGIEEGLLLHKTIRWIEVEGPFNFIPEEVHIFDTPGLGSLYKDHSTITHRFVRLADAVIFVLDSTQLAGNTDIEFLNELLEVTSHIFFIQTKIDQLTPDKYQEILHRHEALLKEHFHDRLTDARVWPIASPLLRKSTKADDPYEVASHHRELAAALQNFLAHVSGWWRTADALIVAESYYDRIRQTIIDDRNALLKSSQERQEKRKQEDTLKREFEASWGMDGKKRKELLANIKRCFDLAKQEFVQAIRSHGDIETLLRRRIDDIGSAKEAKKLAESLVREAEAEAMLRWEQVCDEAAKQCTKLLEPFRVEVMAFAIRPDTGNDGIKVQVTANDGWWARLKHVRGDVMTVTMVGGMASGIATVIFPPAAIVVVPIAIIAAIIAGISGWGKAGTAEVDRGKQQLRQHLSEVMDAIRTGFLNVNFAANHYSHVDEYFEERKQTLAKQVDQIVQQQLAEAQAKINKLNVDNQSEEQQKSRLLEVQRQLAAWIAIGTSMKEAIVELGTLE